MRKYWIEYRRRNRTINVVSVCEKHVDHGKEYARRYHSYGAVYARQISDKAECAFCDGRAKLV
jgi:hypothetical protein